LLEVSAVGIPANPNALALGLKAGAIEKADIKDTLDLLRSFSDSEFKVDASAAFPRMSPITPISPISPIPGPHQLLTLSRTLCDLIRRI